MKEYHDFADIFSKSKAGVLADHRPYDLKIVEMHNSCIYVDIT